MSIVETTEYAKVLDAVRAWPAPMRLSLAESLLQSLHAEVQLPGRRGVPAERVQGIAATSATPPTDQEVKQWIDEHRMHQ
ncbi:MAG TPA: hypothetical protein VND64_11965 [Pirellulales bacterium]|nr:hypothetical protein [Pirellulales bacterium]